MYSAQEIASITGGRLSGDPDLRINSFLHDSRHIHLGEGAMFIAIRSGRNDGHKFVAQAASAGVQIFLVENSFKVPDNITATFVFCASTIPALQKLAAHHRSRFSIPVIGITGSNGKTVVKEWLYQLLKKDHVICRSPKSYNSQLGVPLSVLNLNSTHTLAIFEAGISQPGEMENLERIIRPGIGVFTHLGGAHDQGFENKEEKLREKLILFKDADTLVINGVKKRRFHRTRLAKFSLLKNLMKNRLTTGDFICNQSRISIGFRCHFQMKLQSATPQPVPVCLKY